jgi:hypothetical protein
MKLYDKILSPIVHFSRFIDEIKEHWPTADVFFGSLCGFSLVNRQKRSQLCLKFHPESGVSPGPIMQMRGAASGALSSKLISVEELRIFIAAKVAEESGISWHKFYQHFLNAKVIETKFTDPSCFAGTLLQDLENHVDDLLIFPLWKK